MLSYLSSSSSSIPKEEVKETKTQEQPATPLVKMVKMLRSSKSFNSALTKPIKAKLFTNPTATVSAANTQISQSSSVTFATANFPELANFLLLYDEARVLQVKVHYNMYTSTPAASNGGGIGFVCISFDPTASALGSSAAASEQSFTSGARWISSLPTSGNPSVDLRNGILPCVTAKVPSLLAPITSSDCPGRAWFALDGVTPPTVFQLLLYAQPLGALAVSNIFYYYELDVEFKIRV